MKNYFILILSLILVSTASFATQGPKGISFENSTFSDAKKLAEKPHKIIFIDSYT